MEWFNSIFKFYTSVWIKFILMLSFEYVYASFNMAIIFIKEIEILYLV